MIQSGAAGRFCRWCRSPAPPCRRLFYRGCNAARWPRSEEHTSELQSQSNLVCRLLLEKKKPLPASLLLLPTEPSELERFVCGRLQRECALDGSFAPRLRCGRAYPERRLLDRGFLRAVVTAGVVRGADLEQ